ncbi:MAG: C40 family peptidase [Chlamydiales bacterium]|nr:C40 family peptidase [Chlamydiales bacterium]
MYAYAFCATPLLNTPDFLSSFGGKEACQLPLDSKNLLRPVESIALPGSKFLIFEKMEPHPHILRVATCEYPYQEVYVDSRFLRLTEKKEERKRTLPSKEQILACLKNLIGARYIWGGNWPEGIPELLQYYPPSPDLSQLDPLLLDTWQLKGVDCSGLLYYAANGSVPRNTSELLHFGVPVSIQGKGIQQIAKDLQPLDLIVWQGHVVIVWDEQHAIESLCGKGVIFQSLEKRLSELILEQKKIPLDAVPKDFSDYFIVRRWLH